MSSHPHRLVLATGGAKVEQQTASLVGRDESSVALGNHLEMSEWYVRIAEFSMCLRYLITVIIRIHSHLRLSYTEFNSPQSSTWSTTLISRWSFSRTLRGRRLQLNVHKFTQNTCREEKRTAQRRFSISSGECWAKFKSKLTESFLTSSSSVGGQLCWVSWVW